MLEKDVGNTFAFVDICLIKERRINDTTFYLAAFGSSTGGILGERELDFSYRKIKFSLP